MGHWDQRGLWPWSPSHPAQPRTAPEAQERSPSSQVTGTQDPRAKPKPSLSPWTTLNLDLRTSHLGWGEGARGLSHQNLAPAGSATDATGIAVLAFAAATVRPVTLPAASLDTVYGINPAPRFQRPQVPAPGTLRRALPARSKQPPLLGFFSVIRRPLVNGFVPDLPGMTFVEGTRTGQLEGLHGMRVKRDRRAPSSPLPSPPPR